MTSKIRDAANWIGNQLRDKWVIGTTAALTGTNPLYAAWDTFGTRLFGTNLSSAESFASRSEAFFASYTWMGPVYMTGHALSRRLLARITTTPSEQQIWASDAAYGGTFNLFAAPYFYIKAGVTDIKAIAAGTAGSIVMGAFGNPIVGYFNDAFKDFVGMRSSQRLPRSIRDLSAHAKQALLAGAVAGSVGLCGLIYEINDRLPQRKSEPSPIMQIETHAPTYVTLDSKIFR